VRRLLILLLAVASLGLVARGAIPCDALAAQPACTAALRPGPAETTYGSVQVDGVPTFSSAGELVLTTVRVDINVDFGEWIRNALDPRIDQMQRSLFILPEEDAEDAEQRNQLAMDQSQLVAALAALRSLGFQAPVGAEVVEVVAASAAAQAGLQPGDIVIGLAGAAIDSASVLVEAVQQHAVGDRVQVVFVRAGEQQQVEVTLGELPADVQEGGGPSLGVRVQDALPVDVTIDAGAIGGPSAGLMFALTVIDLLGEDDLTGGMVIAGTGTITADGEVGPIGGIRQKILGALHREQGRPAAVFLVPADNFDEARTAPVDSRILLVPVATLQDALEALTELRAGREPAAALALGG